MLEKTRWYLRRAMFRAYRYFKHPRRLKSSAALRWFARHFLDKRVWRPCQSTFAGGAAIGVFISAQLFPGQMLVGAILAALFRVNIPTVIILSWISNPATFWPIGLAEKHFGDWLLSVFGNPAGLLIERIQNPDVARGVRFAQSMYLGGVIGGLLAAPVAYALAWFSWAGVARLLRIAPLQKRLHLGARSVPAGASKARSDDPDPRES